MCICVCVCEREREGGNRQTDITSRCAKIGCLVVTIEELALHEKPTKTVKCKFYSRIYRNCMETGVSIIGSESLN